MQNIDYINSELMRSFNQDDVVLFNGVDGEKEINTNIYIIFHGVVW